MRIRDLHFRRGSKAIFRGLDMDIPRGRVTTILGPSGTGKTTLLKMIGGQLKAERGTIEVDGLEVGKLRRKALYELRKRLGMLFQSGALLTDLTVFDNVAFPLREHTDLPESLIHHLVLMRLHAVGLRGARDLYPAELSGGMARRAALARALVFDPMMIMYDEPFTGQDPISMGVLIELIRTVNSRPRADLADRLPRSRGGAVDLRLRRHHLGGHGGRVGLARGAARVRVGRGCSSS